MSQTKTWWKEQVIYQIYPRSYQDSNGDGIGDIPGIISRLDYIQSLGIDIIWLSPIYASPNDDNGYDISDYRAIHPDFGTMADFDALLKGIHERGMKLVMDLVVNHTSDEHEWFEKSKSSKDSPYRDYYIWRDAVDGKEPTNWPSFFGGSSWEFHEETQQYYLHLFTKKQPDLNWENARVRQEIHDLVRYWLDKGIDGFRMDVISLISKDYPLTDTTKKAFGEVVIERYANGPRIHEYLHDLHTDVLSQYDVFTVGEGPGITRTNAIDYIGAERGELSMIFHFDHMFMDHGADGKFDPVAFDLKRFLDVIADWNDIIEEGGWISPFFDNHDFQRMISRFGDDGEHREACAKMFAILLLTLRGTPSIYMGSEIGMTNRTFDSIDQCRDVETINFYNIYVEKGGDPATFMKMVSDVGRDNVRVPIQWDSSSHAGFSTAKPWLDVNPNFTKINVKDCESDPASILHFYRELLRFRKQHRNFVYGTWKRIETSRVETFAYEMRFDDQQWQVFLNFSAEQTSISHGSGCTVVMANYLSPGDTFTGKLQAWEGVIIAV